MLRNQHFHWREPLVFTGARARTKPVRGRFVLFLFLFLFVAFAFAFIVIDRPDSAHDLGIVALFSFVPALLVAYPGMWLLARLPKFVAVEERCITIGRMIYPFSTMESAVVTTVRLDGKDFPVLNLQTKGRQSYQLGLGQNVDAEKLATVLAQRGVDLQ